MIQREVTIGRAPDSDILFDPNCIHVSNHHALIYRNGNQLFFKDMSTNGTIINRMRIHGTTVAIHQGDVILLAGRILLSWERINIFFPAEAVLPSNGNRTYIDPQYVSTPENKHSNYSISEEKNFNLAAQIEIETSRFNWGAFLLYQFWGFANGTWWAFLIAVFFGWAFPIPNILFGIMGSKWAWQNKQWNNLEHFKEVQDSWKKWGIGIFLAQLFLSAIFFTVLIAIS